MERFIIKNNNSNSDALAAAVATLRAGGVVLYPTDTQYALGVDALSNTAVDLLYKIKGRKLSKPIHAVVVDTTMAKKYAQWGQVASQLSEFFLPGALTLVLPKQPALLTGITRTIDTFGIRIPGDTVSRELAKVFGGAITATSANRSDKAALCSVDEILNQLGNEAQKISTVLDVGILSPSLPSTIVMVQGGQVELLRKGAIPFSDILGRLALDTNQKSIQIKI